MFKKKNYNHNTILTTVFFTYISQVTLQAKKELYYCSHPKEKAAQPHRAGLQGHTTCQPLADAPTMYVHLGPNSAEGTSGSASSPAASWANPATPPQGSPSLPGATNGKATPHTHLLNGPGPIIIKVTNEMCSRNLNTELLTHRQQQH